MRYHQHEGLWLEEGVEGTETGMGDIKGRDNKTEKGKSLLDGLTPSDGLAIRVCESKGRWLVRFRLSCVF